MRDIKFRAWHKWSREVFYFDNKKVSKDGSMAMSMAALFDGHFGDVMMQYTGLKDKNGVEIYEGDIVEVSDVDKVTHKKISICKLVVSYDNSKAAFNNAWHFCGVKVIGNIHQNPELLEK